METSPLSLHHRLNRPWYFRVVQVSAHLAFPRPLACQAIATSTPACTILVAAWHLAQRKLARGRDHDKSLPPLAICLQGSRCRSNPQAGVEVELVMEPVAKWKLQPGHVTRGLVVLSSLVNCFSREVPHWSSYHGTYINGSEIVQVSVLLGVTV